MRLASRRHVGAEQPAGVTTVDRLAAGGDRDVPVRLYVPRGPVPDGGRPLVVAIPGGRWVRGDVGASVWPCGRIAARVGAVVAHVGCRLAPEHPAPATHLDAYAATVWLAEHAGWLGVRADRIALLGDGPGATVAATVALDARDRGRPAVAFQALVCPATDLTLASPSVAEQSAAPGSSGAALRRSVALYLGDLADPRDPLLSPLLAESHARLPPALVLTAEQDPLRDDGLRYVRALWAAGVPTEHAELPASGSGFLDGPGGCPVTAAAALGILVSALRRALG
jgi:acetyl esterase